MTYAHVIYKIIINIIISTYVEVVSSHIKLQIYNLSSCDQIQIYSLN